MVKLLLSLFGWKYEGWEQVQGCVVIAGALCSVILLLLHILNWVWDMKELDKDREGLSKGHENLSREHKGLEYQMGQERVRLEQSLGKDHAEIRRENAHLTEMVTSLMEESIKNQEREKHLTATQMDIKSSLNILQGMERQMELLQMECSQLKEQKADLERRLVKSEQETSLLRQENQKLQTQLYRRIDYDEPSL